jgi:hypothetical protein
MSRFPPLFRDKTIPQPRNIPVSTAFPGQNHSTTKKHPGFRRISGTKPFRKQEMSRFRKHFQDKKKGQPLPAAQSQYK